MVKASVFFLLLSSIFYFPVFSHAQITTGGSLSDEMTLTLSPEIPKPDESVQFRLEMYTQNLDTAQISWYVDGKQTISGIGIRDFSSTAPKSGQKKTIEVIVRLQNGISFRKQTVLVPQNLDLVWESNSYTPPFYRGKALLPPQGQIKIMALTDINGLVYTWKINGQIRQDLGGYNKNTGVINSSILGKSLVVEVEAINPNTGVSAKNNLVLEPTSPTILFYENSPLYGVLYNQVLKNISLDSEEVTVLGVPYNLSQSNISDSIYTWRVNGARVQDVTSRSAVFRRPTKNSGRSVISLEVNNTVRPLQLSDGSFFITFEE